MSGALIHLYAASVVSRDVLPFTVVHGAPARVVKQVTAMDDISKEL